MSDVRQREAQSGRQWAAGVLAIVAGIACAFSVPGAPADGVRKAKTATLPADLARVPPNAIGFVSVRVAHLWEHPALQPMRAHLAKEFPEPLRAFEPALGTTPDNVERLTLVLPSVALSGNAGPLVYVLTVKPYDFKKLLAALVPKAKEEKRNSELMHVAGRKAVHFINYRAFVFGETGEIQTLLDRGPAKEAGPLTPALHVAAEHHAAVIGGNPAPVLKVTEDRMPPELEPFVPLLEARHGIVSVDFDKQLHGSLRLHYDREAKAAGGAKSLKTLLQLAQGGIDQGINQLAQLKDSAPLVEAMKLAKGTLEGAAVEVQGTDVRLAMAFKLDLSVLGKLAVEQAAKAKKAAARAQSVNNLKQIALAMHNYHSTYGHFPPAATYDKDGKPLLSWRVLILPYIEQDAVYRQFRLDEPWDSDHNKKLIAAVRTYTAPDGKLKPGETCYLGFVGKGALFEGKKGTAINTITDGTSNTLMIVEAANSVPWSKPEDLPFDLAKPLPKLGFRPEGFNAAYCDGSVHLLPAKTKPEKLRALITRNGGEVISNDD